MKNIITIIVFFVSFANFNAQQETYTETNSISYGYQSNQYFLIFTSNTDTYVEGPISSKKSIVIQPTNNYSIILGIKKCTGCQDNGQTTTVKTKEQTSGGKGFRFYNSNSFSLQNQNIGNNLIIKENPADESLAFYLKNNQEVISYEILDFRGILIQSEQIKNKPEVSASLHNLISGNYLLVVTAKNNIKYSQKFIKK